MNFSYNPALINDKNLNQMRFELGDVFVEEPAKTSYLCDEEIIAAIDGSKTFKRAKFRLVETLLRRFSYEVDTKIKEAEWKLNERVDEWKDLYKRLKAELEVEEIGDSFGFTGKKFRPPIFKIGMNDWRKF